MTNWHNLSSLKAKKFQCGFCASLVASERGYSEGFGSYIFICPHCQLPTYFDTHGLQVPGVSPGNEVQHLPTDLASSYKEARACVAAGAFTASVLISRKMLMNIAVEQGATAGGSFVSYVEYLASGGFIPPNGRQWVDHIRKKGNEATHEIALMSRGDAEELILFLEMLLKFIYEFPAKIPQVTKP
ncbi:DUF4145 domain-containing protein [Roseateles noduli]|uniref:DUF4145 domain-containing protein n=1 Tax=Roseateles noduli TaxID=2052484 RepID=UPI003D646CAA